MLAWWFLLRVALAGPPWEKPQSSSRINAGTAEPVRVSPPEAVAYLLEFALHSNTHGVSNTATGVSALVSNTTGRSNTANGFVALFSNNNP